MAARTAQAVWTGNLTEGKGRITVQSGTLDDLRTTTRTSIEITTDRPAGGLESFAGVHALRTDGTSLHFEVDSSALDAVLNHLVPFGVRSLVSQPPTLEELFLRQYGDDIIAEQTELTP